MITHFAASFWKVFEKLLFYIDYFIFSNRHIFFIPFGSSPVRSGGGPNRKIPTEWEAYGLVKTTWPEGLLWDLVTEHTGRRN